jgi:tetratricopeptide (TPR) repeat protein
VAARSRALGRIAAVQAGIGDLEGARLTAQLIEGAYGDAEALIAMADALAERGRMAEAIDLARQIQSAYGNAAALVAVAGRIAETGDIAQAEALAAEIGAIEYQTQARIALARAEARRGQIATALSLVAAVPHRGERAAAVADICASLAVAGDGAGARALARGFASGPALDELILATARAEARAGKHDAALATAEEIEDTLLRAVAAAELARIIGP